MWFVGSSNISKSQGDIKEEHRATLFFWPPESSFIFLSKSVTLSFVRTVLILLSRSQASKESISLVNVNK